MLGVVPANGPASAVLAPPNTAPRTQQRFRALRHAASEFAVGPLSLSAWHGKVQTLSGQCENVSLHGLGVRIPGGARLPLQVGDRLSGVHVTLHSGEVVCHGEAVLRHLRAADADLLLGLQLREGVVDLALLHREQTRCRFSVRCDEMERLGEAQDIRQEFKEWVADLRTYLEVMQGFLDREEAALQNEDLFTRDRIAAQYVSEVGPRIMQKVHEASHRMGPLLAGLSDEEHAVHRAYAQHHIGALVGTSPFMRRVLQKPLGYAGDYELMNMLYRPPEEGSTIFGKVMNLCGVREVAARANINRIGFLADRLRTAIRERRGERALLGSIGSGPAREVEYLLEREPGLGPHCDVMLVDQDPRAIAFCECRLSPISQRTGARLHFIRESVRRLLTGGWLATTLGPRDLIYSAGLFDYLSERSFSTLLQALYDAIVPGGQLLVGNVDVSNPTRYFMEYFGEWFLIHRSREQLLGHGRRLRPAPRSLRVEAEPLGVNLFLIVEK